MEPMLQEDPDKMFCRALEALAAGNTQLALAQLERALKVTDNPSLHSHLGFCIAKERGQVKRGRELCLASLQIEPENPVHYLNLAKVHQIAGDKSKAIVSLREGVAVGGSDAIYAMLNSLGTRRNPPFPFLARNHILNKLLGRLLGKLGMR